MDLGAQMEHNIELALKGEVYDLSREVRTLKELLIGLGVKIGLDHTDVSPESLEKRLTELLEKE